MPKQRSQTHWFNLLVICAFGGVTLSVLVAWWSAYSEDPSESTRMFVSEPPYSPQRKCNGWIINILWDGSEMKVMSYAMDMESKSDLKFYNKTPNGIGPTWSITRQSPTTTGITPGDIIFEESRGWPAQCGVTVIGGSGHPLSWQTYSGIEFGSHRVYPEIPRVLPIKPIWSGLAVNTAFYGVIVFFLIRIFKSARSAIRKRKGLCCGCGYTMNTLGQCPECGLQIN